MGLQSWTWLSNKRSHTLSLTHTHTHTHTHTEWTVSGSVSAVSQRFSAYADRHTDLGADLWAASGRSGTPGAVGTSRAQVLVSEYHSPQKGSKAPQRNGWERRARSELEHLVPESEESLGITGTCEKDTEASWKHLRCPDLGKFQHQNNEWIEL